MDWMSKVYGGSEAVEIVGMDAKAGTAELRLRVDSHHIGSGGVLDEGLVATIADNWTSYLLLAQGEALRPGALPLSVSTSLTVRSLRRINPGATVAIDCCVPSVASLKPFVTATFRDATAPETVYAVASHTKERKDFANANL